jgi:flavin reductase (DIM6/NTAB) family NADH-FMN oxidoreductase RutF
MKSMISIDPKKVSLSDFQGYLQSAVAPRPIALASTIDSQGNVNLSPFSFFNVFGTNPPTLIFAPNRRVKDATQKHTYLNIKETQEVVIHIVDYAMSEQMSLSSCEFAKGVNEFVKVGFTPCSSIKVKPPRIVEAKAAFECVVKQVIEMGENGGAANLIICEVILAHFSEDILDENGKIDPLKTDWIARSGGDWYVRAHADSMFKIPKPNQNVGIGVDAIPSEFKFHFSGNELGRLGNITVLPNTEELAIFKNQNKDLEFSITNVKKYLSLNDLQNAWQILLNIK